MVAISKEIFADARIFGMDFSKFPLASAYNDLPYLYIEGAMSDDEVEFFRASIDRSLQVEARVEKGSDRSVRDTILHNMSGAMLDRYNAILARHTEAIERFFGVMLALATRPQFLHYAPGGHYQCHADNGSELRDKEGNIAGFTITKPTRKITTLFFLSSPEEYEGGELEFCFLYKDEKSVTIKPPKGTLLGFPSHPLFMHRVHEVKVGQRYTIAQWHDVIG